MPTYRFRLDSFEIVKTRAAHTDTDYVSVALKVGDQVFSPQTKGMGDLNDGVYGVELEYVFSIDDPSTPIVFGYLIMNSGHSDTEESIAKLSNACAELAVAATVIPGVGMWGAITAGTIKDLEPVAQLFVADCDGWVAGDQISITGAMLNQWTLDGRKETQRRFYPGTDSNSGCGGNSQYYVTWSVFAVGWSVWHPLGGQIVDEPGVFSRNPEICDVFVRGMDNRLWQNYWYREHWSGFFSHNDEFILGSSPVVDSMGPGHIHVFARGQDGQLWQKWWTDSEGFHDWVPLGGQIIGAPGVRSRRPDTCDVFVQGMDNRLWQNYWYRDHWSGFFPHNDGFILGSSPVVDSMGPSHIHVFARGQDGQLWQKWWIA